MRVDRYLTPDELEAALRDDVRRGLASQPKELPPKWFYDERGSQLFDQITRLPEYYPTRCERALLRANAGAIAARAGVDVLVELGSGTSEKTRLLLDALRPRDYVPFDVDEATLASSARALEGEYPGMAVHGVVGDFTCDLGRLPRQGRRLIAFLGSTIGNLGPDDRAMFLVSLRACVGPGDSLLLGVDLVKDVDRLHAAYDDEAGVTAEFNRNALRFVNRELGADFDVDAFEHVARWDATNRWIEMRLRATSPMKVRLETLDLAVAFDEGEELRTEISCKFTPDGIATELATAGFDVTDTWVQGVDDFLLLLATPRE